MSENHVSDETPGSELFPEYWSLYDLIEQEVTGLTEAQLDFCSDQWRWAEWSIRRQLSHMASLIYRWMVIAWGKTLFPSDDHGVEDVQGLTGPTYPWLEEQRYWEPTVLLDALRNGIELIQRVLTDRKVDFLRAHTYRRTSDTWPHLAHAHPTGVTRTDDPKTFVLTMEATFRHIYFEEITHLYNIQRLKRAQGLPQVVELPQVGYWMLEGWDRSEAN